jgi:ribosomal protein L7/L12
MPDRDAHDVQLPAAAAAAIARGSKIEAIRLVREGTGLGLYEAKQLVEKYIAASPALKSQFEQQQAAMKRRIFRWVLVVDALIFAAAIWWFFGR